MGERLHISDEELYSHLENGGALQPTGTWVERGAFGSLPDEQLETLIHGSFYLSSPLAFASFADTHGEALFEIPADLQTAWCNLPLPARAHLAATSIVSISQSVFDPEHNPSKDLECIADTVGLTPSRVRQIAKWRVEASSVEHGNIHLVAWGMENIPELLNTSSLKARYSSEPALREDLLHAITNHMSRWRVSHVEGLQTVFEVPASDIQQVAWDVYLRNTLQKLEHVRNFRDVTLAVLSSQLLHFFPDRTELSPYLKSAVRDVNKKMASDESETKTYRLAQWLHRLDYLARTSSA